MAISKVGIESVPNGDAIRDFLLTGIRSQAYKNFVEGKCFSTDGSHEVTVTDIAEALTGRIQKVSLRALRSRVEKTIEILEGKEKNLSVLRDKRGVVRKIRFHLGLCGELITIKVPSSEGASQENSFAENEGKKGRTILRKKNCCPSEDISAKVERPMGRPEIHPPSKPRGEEHDAQNKGDRNEARFFKLVRRWVDTVRGPLHKNGVGVRIRRSNKFDSDDRSGDDVSIWFKRNHKHYRFIYDVKSSLAGVKEFDAKFRLASHQKNVVVKRAVLVNDDVYDWEILGEITRDVYLKLYIKFSRSPRFS